jgi:alpha-L-rhamnosidase
MHSPTGVHVSDFRFSWNLNSNEHNQVQRAYEIKMYSDKACTSLAWTSGIVKSSASINVKYSGKSLLPGASYYWQVRVWDTNSKASNWSKPDRFITELSEADWHGAKWIAFETMGDSSLIVPGVHAPYVSTLGRKGIKRYTVPFFRKSFGVKKKIQEALVFVSGMGHYELSINGMKVHDSFIAPGWTAYSKRSLYNTYDVTRFLTEGKNAIGITVGNGFFNINRERYFKLITAYGPPQAVCRLWIKYDDNSTESIVTNNEWRTSPSPTTFSSIYGGEDYDARQEQGGWDTPEFNDGSWRHAIEVSGRGRLLSPEVSYPVKIMESIPAKGNRKLSETKYLYDFGQNASGVVRLRVKGKKGQVVKLSPAELIKGDRIQQGASGEPCYFVYTLKGDGVEEWVPKFTYYGFRYVEVEGARPLSEEKNDAHPTIVGLSLEHNRNSTPQVGSFECSNQLFNQINNLIIWAIKSNMQSTITDCPHREKLGWLEQDYLMGESIQFNYDIFSLYKKITYDMMDAQRKDGLVPDIAPELVVFEGGFLDSPEWGSSAVLVPWLIYKNYGDDKILRDAYPMMKNYVRYLEGKAKNNLLSHGLGDWFDYGPNSPGEAQLTPKTLTATAIYYYDVTLMQHIAALLTNKADAAYYDKLAKQVKDSFNKQFFDRGAKL